MKQLMRYRITSGRAVEVRDVMMETRGHPARGGKRGTSSPKQRKRNEEEAVLILARQLNANCKGGDLFLTLRIDVIVVILQVALPGGIQAGRGAAEEFGHGVVGCSAEVQAHGVIWSVSGITQRM